MTGPVLETSRLRLRPPVESDLDGWAALMADETAARFIGGAQERPVAWRGMASVAGSWALRGFGMFSVLERGSGRWVGRIGPWRPEGWPGPEIGWGLIREVWGRGYATEAAAAAIDWALESLGWPEFIHLIAPENDASVAVARRLGSTLREPGRMPPPYHDRHVEIWGQNAARWRARRDAGGWAGGGAG